MCGVAVLRTGFRLHARHYLILPQFYRLFCLNTAAFRRHQHPELRKCAMTVSITSILERKQVSLRYANRMMSMSRRFRHLPFATGGFYLVAWIKVGRQMRFRRCGDILEVNFIHTQPHVNVYGPLIAEPYTTAWRDGFQVAMLKC